MQGELTNCQAHRDGGQLESKTLQQSKGYNARGTMHVERRSCWTQNFCLEMRTLGGDPCGRGHTPEEDEGPPVGGEGKRLAEQEKVKQT